MKTMLTIAGFDPSSGAGVTADLGVFAAEGCFGTSCITALTVQSTVGVKGVEPVPAGLVTRTLDCLWEDLPADGVKIGMLATAEIVLAVAKFLLRIRNDGWVGPVVLDPVVRSSSGRALLEPDGIRAMLDRLLPLVDWITPNLGELEILAGTAAGSESGMEAGARQLQAQYQRLGVVVTGGHLQGRDGVKDLVAAAGGMKQWLHGERVTTRSTHGTGCVFSSVLACGLARGMNGFAAAEAAKGFVEGAMRHATPLGSGHGPLNLRWRSASPAGAVG